MTPNPDRPPFGNRYCCTCNEWDGYRFRCLDVAQNSTGYGQCGPMGWCQAWRPVKSEPNEPAARGVEVV